MNERRERRDLILLAEDNRGDAMLIRRSLDEHHVEHTMLIMEDGERAIQYFDQTEADESARVPDLLLLDLNLPKRSGEEILTRVRQSVRSRSIPVVIVTSSDAMEDREMARSLGATEYFQKVTDLAEYMQIGAVVKRILRNRSALSAGR